MQHDKVASAIHYWQAYCKVQGLSTAHHQYGYFKPARYLALGRAASSDPPLRASNDHRFIVGVPRVQRVTGAALRPSCSGSSGPHIPVYFSPSWGVAWLNPQLRASSSGRLIFTTSLKGSGRGCPLLRASNEHIPIVRVLRARRAPGHSLFIPFFLVLSPSQQGGLFGLPLRASNEGLLRPRVARAQETNRLPCPSLDCPFPPLL